MRLSTVILIQVDRVLSEPLTIVVSLRRAHKETYLIQVPSLGRSVPSQDDMGTHHRISTIPKSRKKIHEDFAI
jgi:hypothetical protein